MNETRYNIYPKVQYGTEHRRACPRNRSVETLARVSKHWSCIRACPRNRSVVALAGVSKHLSCIRVCPRNRSVVALAGVPKH